MKIINKFKYTREKYLKVSNFMFLRKLKVLILLLLIFIAFGIIHILFYDKTFGIIFSVISYILFILWIISYKRSIELTYSTNPLYQDNLEVEYRFFNDYYEIILKSDHYTSHSKLYYNLLYKVYETKKYFVLKYNFSNFNVIDKIDFIFGTSEELSKILSKYYKRFNLIKGVKRNMDKKVDNINIFLENGKSFSILGRYVEEISWQADATKRKTCKYLILKISNNANDSYENETLFDYIIKEKNICEVKIVYNNQEKTCVWLPWDDKEDYFQNALQKASKDANGNLEIVVNE